MVSVALAPLGSRSTVQNAETAPQLDCTRFSWSGSESPNTTFVAVPEPKFVSVTV
jgi:hypothetical protein